MIYLLLSETTLGFITPLIPSVQKAIEPMWQGSSTRQPLPGKVGT